MPHCGGCIRNGKRPRGRFWCYLFPLYLFPGDCSALSILLSWTFRFADFWGLCTFSDAASSPPRFGRHGKSGGTQAIKRRRNILLDTQTPVSLHGLHPVHDRRTTGLQTLLSFYTLILFFMNHKIHEPQVAATQWLAMFLLVFSAIALHLEMAAVVRSSLPPPKRNFPVQHCTNERCFPTSRASSRSDSTSWMRPFMPPT